MFKSIKSSNDVWNTDADESESKPVSRPTRIIFSTLIVCIMGGNSGLSHDTENGRSP